MSELIGPVGFCLGLDLFRFLLGHKPFLDEQIQQRISGIGGIRAPSPGRRAHDCHRDNP
jgi:hypothetical protein